jgi:hypothetical protein
MKMYLSVSLHPNTTTDIRAGSSDGAVWVAIDDCAIHPRNAEVALKIATAFTEAASLLMPEKEAK